MNSLNTKGSGDAGAQPVIALVGCGAIAEQFHLPALARSLSLAAQLIPVDADLDRARAFAERHGTRPPAADLGDVLDEIDGAIIAVPHGLHHRLTLQCIRSGVRVLCEKPIAERPHEVREIVEESDRLGVAVAVNNTRRLVPALRAVKELIAAGEIGQLRTLSLSLGERFGWPAVTPSYFGAAGSGKGVLLDVGAHVIDLVCWWLGDKPEIISYQDDSRGGTEAVVKLTVALGECRGDIRLSWLSTLENTYRIEGDGGAIEGGIFDLSSFTTVTPSGKRTTRKTAEIKTYNELANPLIENFIAVAAGDAEPLISARDVAPSIELIDECYSRRSRFEMPWYDTFAEAPVA